MRVFKCQECEQLLYFENCSCERCGHRLGYLPESNTPFGCRGPGPMGCGSAGVPPGARYRFCAKRRTFSLQLDGAGTINRPVLSCVQAQQNYHWVVGGRQLWGNWRKPQSGARNIACSIPCSASSFLLPTELRIPREVWHSIFWRRRRPIPSKVLTGHDDGVITLNLKEADDVIREQSRTAMGETYRTLFGHFRHEIGHYFWDRLVRDAGRQEVFRDLFGDERTDYDEALKQHYASGPPGDWQQTVHKSLIRHRTRGRISRRPGRTISISSTQLRWPGPSGVRIAPEMQFNTDQSAAFNFDPYEPIDMNCIIKAWLPLAFSVNAINRCMGEPANLYHPFILSPPVITKMAFIHGLVHQLIPPGSMENNSGTP